MVKKKNTRQYIAPRRIFSPATPICLYFLSDVTGVYSASLEPRFVNSTIICFLISRATFASYIRSSPAGEDAGARIVVPTLADGTSGTSARYSDLFFAIRFEEHPDLRLPAEPEGLGSYPLLKDYPVEVFAN